MNVFKLRSRLVDEYGSYVRSFIQIRDHRIRDRVAAEMEGGLLWPEPLIQLNPSFAPGGTVEDLVAAGTLHDECARIFRADKTAAPPGKTLRLYRHQVEAIEAARRGDNYVLTTGTGSGKSLAYIVPIVDHVLRNGSGRGIQAIVVYPMNALANSQIGELEKYLCAGYPERGQPVTFRRYTGQEKEEERAEIVKHPPDILLTNYVMLELLLTRPYERALVNAAHGLRFLVLDELHTYRGRQGADVAMLVRRAREAFASEAMRCVGTSATLAGKGNFEQQRAEVAHVATRIFGAAVRPECVIGETLQRTTAERDPSDTRLIDELQRRVADESFQPAKEFQRFIEDPLSIWIESTFGLSREEGSGRLIRSKPLSISGSEGAAFTLAKSTGLPQPRCAAAIEGQLLASYGSEPNPANGFPVFAFRLHQFISRGDTVYASIEREDTRHISLQGQQFVPGDRSRVLLPLVFCRECGQEYYCARASLNPETGGSCFLPRELSDRTAGDDTTPGFLYVDTDDPWPAAESEVLERLPEDWLEEGKQGLRVRRDRREWLPRRVSVEPDGQAGSGLDCHFVRASFRFCLRCGVAYGFRQTSDFGKLASLATEGRSTATTILSLTAILQLRADTTLEAHARKLLSFTDNRQDASLQAGHFNDFVEIGLMRSALYRAVAKAGADGLAYDELPQRVFEALSLPISLYAVDPAVKFQALEETRRALRQVIAYRLYRDLKRGWRITLPNLEQCGLLEIEYLSLDDLCRAEEEWSGGHPALVSATPEVRSAIAKTLLDLMRRELAIKIEALQPEYQERIRQQSQQRLCAPWAVDEAEVFEQAAVLYPRPKRKDDDGSNLYLSPRGGFGQYLRRSDTFPGFAAKLGTEDTEHIIGDLLKALQAAGLVEVVDPAKAPEVPGYQLPASALRWRAGDGVRAFHDPIRVPRAPRDGGRTNPFFVEFYREVAAQAVGLEAREHTAQVQYEDREDRETRFRTGALPILYCSPTMELGVDISQLNAVNLRNIPPTPANYAQRSGRAGRSGQPAIVFSYCSTYSSHDQYFFRRPERMVAGAVTPPRLDLANEDLLRAHVHALWLSETGLDLGNSLSDLLDLADETLRLPLLERVADSIRQAPPRSKAQQRAQRVLASIAGDLKEADWFSAGWLDEALVQVERRFDEACTRWRGLYRAATHQRELQHKIILDHSRSNDDKQKARRLRAEAEAQIDLLTLSKHSSDSDFYSYRYFASEGFLPGYSFPRLPLSAFIPGRRKKVGRDDFLSRPRFLAISEFGPRAIVYHEGSRYRVNKVILAPERGDSDSEDILTTAAKQCGTCGYLHPASTASGPDLCERCGVGLGLATGPLFRLQNVAAKRADRISSDEEERLRLGYEIRTGVRFADHDGRPSHRVARITADGEDLCTLTYGSAATLWRINLGWRRRADKQRLGFMLDVERGYWARNNEDPEDDDGDALSGRTRRVIPYVEDRRNCLLVEWAASLDITELATLQAALKNALQVEFQLEESELAAEPLPTAIDRHLLLFYEAAEGGAGVLRQLLDDEEALPRVARQALQLCHFDPDTGADLRCAPGSREDCEAACYDCMMSYTNQQDHALLDRQRVLPLLRRLQRTHVDASPTPAPRAAHFDELLRLCGSELERHWLRFVHDNGLRLPSDAQPFIEACSTRPDFLYGEHQTAVYIDGSPHEYPDRRERDRQQTACMMDAGFTIVRFTISEEWAAVFARNQALFGKLKGEG